MRLLTVGNLDPYANVGGYERVWRAAVAHWRAGGHEVAVVADFALDVRDGRWRRPSRWRDLRNRRVLRRALSGDPWDAVVWFGMGGLSLALLDEAAGLPQLAVVHDGWPVYGRGEPRAVPGEWTFNSAYTRDRVLAEGWAPASVSIVQPGVDAGEFGFVEADSWRGRLAYVGRVEEQKGLAVAVEALRALPGCRLTITGTGPLVVSGDRVTVAGAGDPAAALAACDAFVFPVTWQEPFGLAPLEAMAVGRPVIATFTGGSGEYLRDGVNAVRVPPGDAAALAAAVRALERDPALRARLVAGGRSTAARFTQDAFLRGLDAALERVAL